MLLVDWEERCGWNVSGYCTHYHRFAGVNYPAMSQKPQLAVVAAEIALTVNARVPGKLLSRCKEYRQ